MVMSTANSRFGSVQPVQNPQHFARHVTDVTGEGLGRLLPPKMFAQPFRLVFKRHRTEAERKLGKAESDVSWIEVRSLGGLRNVVAKLDSGELEEIDRFSSLEMQLWGLLAEHAGFLRVQGSASMLAAGIQPLGEEPAALAEDLASIMGGSDMDALNVLNEMQKTLKGKPIDRTPMEQVPLTNEFVKPDGVNYTERGEDALRELVLGDKTPTLCPPGQEKAKEFQKDIENAVQIFRETPEPSAEELAQEIQERIDCEIAGEGSSCKKNATPPTGPVKTGAEAALAGRLLADTARGLDNPEDAEVQKLGDVAVEIALNQTEPEAPEAARKVHSVYGGDFEPHPEADPKDRVPGLEDFNVSMSELKLLATSPTTHRRDPMAKSKIGTAEALKAQDDNLKKVMEDVSETALTSLVDQSPSEPLDPECLAENQTFSPPKPISAEVRKRLEASGLKFEEPKDQISGADHYKQREVKPASEVPTDQDERAKWLAEQQRGPASMDTYRDEEQRKDPYYGSVEEHRKSNDQGPDEE